MPPVRTITLTVNGPDGRRFLASLGSRRRRHRFGHLDVPVALYRLIDSGRGSIEVSARDAEHVAEFVDELVAAGWIDDRAPPVVLTQRRGERVTLRRAVLVERLRGPRDGDPPHATVYVSVAAGTPGLLLDWERDRDRRLAVIELDDRSIVFVSEAHVAFPGPRIDRGHAIELLRRRA